MRLNPFNLQNIEIENPYFIAHLYDRVLVGRKGENSFSELEEAIEQDNVLEVHLFNNGKEVCATRINESLIAYKTLHPLDIPKEQVKERVYQLEPFARPYHQLKVKEYIEFDEDHLAYVKQTILCSLESTKGKGGSKK